MPKCSVPDCDKEADYEAVLYDVYPYDGKVFFERDITCPFICAQHVIENEEKARGVRKPRGIVYYPFTNKHGAQGFTIYKPLE